MKTKEQLKDEYLNELRALYKRHNESQSELKRGLDGGFPIREEKEITNRYLEELKEIDECKK